MYCASKKLNTNPQLTIYRNECHLVSQKTDALETVFPIIEIDIDYAYTNGNCHYNRELSYAWANNRNRVPEIIVNGPFRAFNHMARLYFDGYRLGEAQGRDHELIPNLVNELNLFAVGVQKDFSNKNVSEIQELAQNLIKSIKAKPHTHQHILSFPLSVRRMLLIAQSATVEDIAELNNSADLSAIKICLIEQEHLIAESKLFDCPTFVKSTVNLEHHNRIIKFLDLFNDFCGDKSRHTQLLNEGLAHGHSIENAAALFSSCPEKMQEYLKKRQEVDIYIVNNHLDSIYS